MAYRRCMFGVEAIRHLLAAGHYSLSRHAMKRMVERNIGDDMIRCAGAVATIIEDYPDDKYSPSCLMLGFADNIPLHLQVSRAPNPAVHIITLYIPSLAQWEAGYSQRRHHP